MNPPWVPYISSDNINRKEGYRAQTAPPGSSYVDGPLHPDVLLPGRSPGNIPSENSDLFFAGKARPSSLNEAFEVPPPPPPVPVTLYTAQVVNAFQPPVPPPPPVPSRPSRPISFHHPSLFFAVPAPPPLPPSRPPHSPPPSHPSISSNLSLPPLPPKIPLLAPSLPASPVVSFNECSHSSSSLASNDISPNLDVLHDPTAIKDTNSPMYDDLSADAMPSDELSSAENDTQNQTVSHQLEQELAEAMALSEVLSTEERKIRDKITSQEDEDLARALEASWADHEQPSAPSEPHTLPVHLTSSESEIPSLLTFPHSQKSNSRVQTFQDDEAFARHLAGQDGQASDQHGNNENENSSLETNGAELPRYASQIRTQIKIHVDESASSLVETAATRSMDTNSPAQNSQPNTPVATRIPLPCWSPPSYNESHVAQTNTDLAPPEIARNQPNRPEELGGTVLLPPIRNIHRAFSLASTLDGTEPEAQSSSDPNAHGLVNINSFVDKELFFGVSVGFLPPTISAEFVPMSTVMPNIISLPYGRAAPLHFQGPNWRHLLKLMAKLSGTRLEPTVAAMAISKKDLKLRTVVQFIKPYPSAPDWRTILYFTIDFPPPFPLHQNVNELPYSYTLSQVPTLLHQASDTPVSKTYTIPSSDSLPYPTLPITFPNLATYLQASLDESRRYLNDSSSNHRKLAKMIDVCYKSDSEADRLLERQGVSGLFKKVIGRSSKATKRGQNEETYELVTPFVADEWG